MAFCSKCGKEYEEGAKFCPTCGAAPNAADQQSSKQTDYVAKISELNNTADTTADFEKADIEQNKVMGVLAYLSWLVLVPIFAASQSKFARFHANQGLVLAISEIIFGIAHSIISFILFAISWRLVFILLILSFVYIAVFLAMTILGIVNAANGRAKELPVIGKIRILK